MFQEVWLFAMFGLIFTRNPKLLNYSVFCNFIFFNVLFSPLAWCIIYTQLALHKDPTPLVYDASFDKPLRSHATHHVLTQWKLHWRKEETDNTLTDKTEQVTFVMKQKYPLSNLIIFIRKFKYNTFLWLFNLSWQIAVVHQFKQHVNWSSLPLY